MAKNTIMYAGAGVAALGVVWWMNRTHNAPVATPQTGGESVIQSAPHAATLSPPNFTFGGDYHFGTGHFMRGDRMSNRMPEEAVKRQTRHDTATFYNLGTVHERGVSRHAAQEQVNNEIRAQLESEKPKVAGYVEAIGWHLPRVPGYRLLRDISTAGRANVAAYVAKSANLQRGSIKWHDLTDTWDKTNPGATGQHPARSFLTFRADGERFVIAHLAPPHTGAAGIAAQRQEYAAIQRVVSGRAPALVLGDFNPNATEHGATTLAGMIGGRAANATRADNAVLQDLVLHAIHYVANIGHVVMHSDHGSYVRIVYSRNS